MRYVIDTILLIMISTACLPAAAETPYNTERNQATHRQGAEIATEPGQGAFAAISEIVQLLRTDPNTEWQTVQIGDLRQHVVDMSRLILEADVEEVFITDGLTVRISLQGLGGQAARRMVPTHSIVLAAETGWRSSYVLDGSSLIWVVTAPGAARQIRALGFYGLMALGDHHPRHHVAIARGKAMHPH